MYIKGSFAVRPKGCLYKLYNAKPPEESSKNFQKPATSKSAKSVHATGTMSALPNMGPHVQLMPLHGWQSYQSAPSHPHVLQSHYSGLYPDARAFQSCCAQHGQDISFNFGMMGYAGATPVQHNVNNYVRPEQGRTHRGMESVVYRDQVQSAQVQNGRALCAPSRMPAMQENHVGHNAEGSQQTNQSQPVILVNRDQQNFPDGARWF